MSASLMTPRNGLRLLALAVVLAARAAIAQPGPGWFDPTRVDDAPIAPTTASTSAMTRSPAKSR